MPPKKTKVRKNFRLQASSDGKSVDLFIYDVIGEDFWGCGVSAADVAKSLATVGDASTITVHINSPGGAAWDGMAIYNTLCQHPAEVTVEVEGIAASAASIIAMAGDTINMAENAMMMIHPAQGMTMGDADEMRKTADILDKLDGQISNTYAKRSGGSADDFMAAMRAETYYTADEALAAGLCTAVTGAKAVQAAFDRKIINRIAKRPERILALLRDKTDLATDTSTTPALTTTTTPAPTIEAIQVRSRIVAIHGQP